MFSSSVCVRLRVRVCVFSVCDTPFETRGEQWGKGTSLRVLFCYFFSWKKGRKFLFFKKRLLLCGASASLSLAFSFAKNTLERSFVVYRLSDCVWWCCAFAFASYVRYFSLVVVKVLFFPLCIEEELFCTATHKSKALISLYSFSSNSLSFLVVKVASRRSADFSQTLTRSLTIFSFASYHQHQHKEEIYNNAAFPRAIP